MEKPDKTMPELFMKPWEPTVIDEHITIPDELDKLTNYVGTQLRFHTISGMSEGECVAHIVWKAQKFFSEHSELLLK